MKNILEMLEDPSVELSTVNIIAKNNIWQAVISYKKYKNDKFVWDKKWKSTGVKAPNNKRQAKDIAKKILEEFDNNYRNELLKTFKPELFNDVKGDDKVIQFKHEHLGMNFAEFLRMRLETVRSAKNYSKGTYDNYDQIIENHMKPYFNNKEKQYKVYEINSDVIQEYLVETKNNGRKDKKDKENLQLKNSTLLHHVKLINVAFKHLVDKQFIPSPTARNRQATKGSISRKDL